MIGPIQEECSHSFIHSFCKLSMSIHFVSGPALSAGNTESAHSTLGTVLVTASSVSAVTSRQKTGMVLVLIKIKYHNET